MAGPLTDFLSDLGGPTSLGAGATPSPVGAVQAPITGTPSQDQLPLVGEVLIYPESRPTLGVKAALGGYPKRTAGYGGHEGVPLPRRVAFTKWNGFDLAAFDVEMILDDRAAGRSVERACLLLDGMAGRGALADGTAPPPVIVDTAGVMSADHVAFPDNRWVIDGLDWHEDDDDETFTNSAGNRTRALVTVSLLQWHTNAMLKTAADQLARVTGPSGKTRTVKSTASLNSLQAIARKYLGDAGKWTVLSRLNPGIRDPRNLKAGTSVKVPK